MSAPSKEQLAGMREDIRYRRSQGGDLCDVSTDELEALLDDYDARGKALEETKALLVTLAKQVDELAADATRMGKKFGGAHAD